MLLQQVGSIEGALGKTQSALSYSGDLVRYMHGNSRHAHFLSRKGEWGLCSRR